MSKKQTPDDWVLVEAAKRSGFGMVPAEVLREDYATPTYQAHHTYRALCDMIAKYEQPPVDPDVEAVKRIFAAVNSYVNGYWDTKGLDRAVAQYKLERAK